MRSGRWPWLPWLLFFVATAFSALASIFLILGRSEPSPAGTFGFRGFAIVFALTFATVGLMVAARRPENSIGWVFLSAGVLSGFQEMCQQYAIYALFTKDGSIPLGVYAAWTTQWIWIPITGLITGAVFLLFPTGRPHSPRWRFVPFVTGTLLAIPTVVVALAPGRIEVFEEVQNPFGVEGFPGPEDAGASLIAYMLAIVISVISLILRFKSSRGEERQQLKWFVTASAFAASSLILAFVTSAGIGTVEIPWFDDVVVLSFLTIPVSAGVAILRYRLLDIDLVINKALVYGLLAALVTGLYILLVALPAAAVFGVSRNGILPLIAIIAISLVIQPARRRAQKFANRLVFGERATPYEAMALFSEQMATAISLEEVLPRMAEAAARGIGATKAAVRLILEGSDDRIAVWPEDADPLGMDETLQVVHRGEVVGEISVCKPVNDPLSSAEEKLLRDLAAQAGPALHNVRLTGELQARLVEISAQAEELRASRQRIVSAQDTERRRIERDIHDGAQQQLVSLAVKISLVKNLFAKDPAKASEILEQMKSDTSEAVESLRDLARGLFPPILVDHGLVAAVEAHVAKANIPATSSDETMGLRFAPAIEANIFFIIKEALQNASKHAPGAQIDIEIKFVDQVLSFRVADHGPGFVHGEVALGNGLQNMQDRLEALGGKLEIESTPAGTRVTGWVSAEPVTDSPQSKPQPASRG